MSRSKAHSTSPGLLSLVVVALVLLAPAMWIAHQGGLAPVEPAGFLAALDVLINAVIYVIPLWIGAAGLGWAIRFVLLPHVKQGLVIQLGLGLAVMLFCDWGLGLAGWLNCGTAWGICGLGAVLLVHQSLQARYRQFMTSRELPAPPWPVVLACPVLGIMLVACTCPPGTIWRIEALGYDVLSYHLELPREWLALGRIEGLHHNVYSYLPNLVEAGYTAIGTMAGSIYDGVYVAQVFHLSVAIFAALAVGAWVLRALGGAEGQGHKSAAALAGVLLLLLPWTVVTGTMAYDEMFALSLGVVAMVVAFDPNVGLSWRGAVAAGFLAGAATLAKLPFGPMLALPLGIVYLLGLGQPSAAFQGLSRRAGTAKREGGVRRNRFLLAAVAGLAGLLTLTPYFIRNDLWAGNPVFPFAATHLGRAYWGPTEVEKWNRGHGLSGGGEHIWWNLGRLWLFNAGYGAIGSLAHPTPPFHESQYNVAKFTQEWGFPLLWLLAGGGAVMGLCSKRRPDLRRPTIALMLTLAVQLIFWTTCTHMQSRFLIPSLLPGCGLVGLLIGGMIGRTKEPDPLAYMFLPVASVILAAILTVNTYLVFQGQLVIDMQKRQSVAAWVVSASLLPEAEMEKLSPDTDVVGNHPINHLPKNSRTYLVADNADLLWVRRPMVYESAFDPCMLGQLMRQFHREPRAVSEALRSQGITNVWVNWGELKRLHETYGFDPDVTQASLTALAAGAGWKIFRSEQGWYTLFALP